MTASTGRYLAIWGELQQRAIVCFLTWLVLVCVCFWQRDYLLISLKYPLEQLVTNQPPLVTLSVTDGFYISFQMACNTSFFMVSPLLIYHLWCFLFPALHLRERILFRVLLWVAVLLFTMGSLFGWLVVLPLLFSYGRLFIPSDVMWMVDFRQYIGLFWSIGLYGGLVFELPLVIAVLAQLGWLRPDHINQSRGYVFLSCFVVGMLATPPDMFAQIAFALPLYGLFELGWLGRRLLTYLIPDRREVVSL